MFFSPNDWQSIIFRLTMALLIGGAIGLNRQGSGRPVGLRTFLSGVKKLKKKKQAIAIFGSINRDKNSDRAKHLG